MKAAYMLKEKALLRITIQSMHGFRSFKSKKKTFTAERTKSSLNLHEGFLCSRISWSDPDPFTDTKEKKIFLKYKEIQMGAVAKSYMRKGFLIYEEMRKYLVIYEENMFSFLISVGAATK
jgi:hypothetical protein